MVYRTRSRCGSWAWLPYWGMVVGLSSSVACSRGDNAESSETASSATARQAIEAEPTAPDTSGNSPATQELAFIPNMGFVDGTTCQTWPGVTLLDASAESGALPLAQVVGKFKAGSPESTVLNQITTAFADHAINEITTIASKNELVIEMIGGRPFVFDLTARKAFEMTSGYLCTKADVESGECVATSIMYIEPSTSADVLVDLLRRNTLRSDIPAVMLIAPQVRVPENLELDTNVIVVADQFVGGAPLTDDLLKRTETVSIKVRPHEFLSDWNHQSNANLRGLFISVASQMGGIGAVTASSVGVEKLYVTDAANPIAALAEDKSLNSILKTPEELMALEVAPTWNFQTEVREMVSMSPGDNNGGGYMQTLLERKYHGNIAFNPLPPARADGTKGGTVIVVAGQAAAGTTVSAPGMQSTSLTYSAPAIKTYLTAVLDKLSESQVEHGKLVSWKTRTAEDLATDGSSLWSPDYAPEFCQQDVVGNWSCKPLKVATSYPPSARVMLDAFSATWTMGSLTGEIVCAKNSFGDPTQRLDVDLFTLKVIRTLEGYYGSTVNGIPSAPKPGTPGTAVLEVGNTNLATSLANVVSRGLYFTELYHSADNASRRASIPNLDKWNVAAQESSKSTLLASYQDASPPDTDLTAAFGIDLAKWNTTQGWKKYADAGLASLDSRLNALGLPYGRVGTGWRELSYNTGSSVAKTYLSVERRWSQVADLVDDLNIAADTQRVVGQLSDVSNRLDQTLSAATTFIGQVGSASTALAKSADENAALQNAALAKLKSVAAKVEENRKSLDASIRSTWSCTNQDYSICTANMNTMLEAVNTQCKNAKATSYFGSILSFAAAVVPYVAAAQTVLDMSGLNAAVAKSLSGDKDVLDEAIKQADGARKSIEETAAKIDATQNFTSKISDLVKAGLPECDDPQSAAYASAKTALTAMATLDGLVQLYATNLGTLEGIVDSLVANIQHLLVTVDIYNGLKASSESAIYDLQHVGSSGGSLATDLATRRSFIDAACRTTLVANQVLQSDLFSVSQALQTTTGQSYTEPSLYVPANPTYLNQGNAGTSFGYLVSLWEPARFGRRLSSSGTMNDNFMARSLSRISTFWNEVCDASGDSLPQTRFVIRKQVKGDDLKNLRETGTAGIFVSLEDVLRGGNAQPDVVTAIAAEYAGTWNLLSAPVILSTAYSACTGPAANPCGTGTRLEPNPYLVKEGSGRVPTLTCGPTILSDTAAEPIHARARTCLASVQVPRSSWSVSWEDLSIPDQSVTTKQLDAACGVDVSAVIWGSGRGLPVVGPWTLAANPGAIAGADAPVTIPSDVSAIEVAFVVGAEPAHENAELGSTLDTRAYSIENCTPEVLNGLDDDCDGVIDDGLIPPAMAFEGSGSGSGAWTAPAPAVVSYTTARHTEGQYALKVNAKGYATVTSPNVLASTLTQVGSVLLLDVYILAGQPNPNWLGAIGLTLSMPSQGIYSVYLGNVNLTGLTVGGWNTIAFSVPSNIQTTLLTKDGAVQYQISVNVPSTAPAVLLDNLRFGGNLKLRSSGTAVRSTLANLLSFERLADWTGTNSTLALNTALVSDGASSLLLTKRTSDYSTATSAPIYASDFTSKKTAVLVDYAAGALPAWGSVQLTMQCPLLTGSRWIGYQSVLGMTPNTFHPLKFALPAEVQTALIAPNSECSLTLALSAPLGIAYRFDNIRFQ